MIRSILFTQSEGIQNIATDQIEAVLGKEDGFLWVDMVSESIEACKPLFNHVIKFHPLSIDDALLETHVPKVDDWDIYLYLVLRSVKTEIQDSYGIRTSELDIFLGSDYLVTYHEEPLTAVEKIWKLGHQDSRYLSKGAGYLHYHIADEIVTNTMTLIEDLDVKSKDANIISIIRGW